MAPQGWEHSLYLFQWLLSMDTHFLGVGRKPSFCPWFERFSWVVKRECDTDTRLNRKLEEVQAQIAVLAPFYSLSSLFVGVGCSALVILSVVLNYIGPFPMLLLGLYVELYIKNCWLLDSEALMKLQKAWLLYFKGLNSYEVQSVKTKWKSVQSWRGEKDGFWSCFIWHRFS